MISSTRESEPPRAKCVSFTDSAVVFELLDEARISAPLEWYPRLYHGRPEERGHWRLIGNGAGVHWPDLDEDISVENILAGKRSLEGLRSFNEWLQLRTAGRT